MKADAVLKLKEFVNEEPPDKPSWWSNDCKTDSEGALLCLLMTGVSEPGIVKWFTEKFVTVVRAFCSDLLTKAKRTEMGEENP